MITLEQPIQEITTTFTLSFVTFCVAMLLTPLYSSVAYKYKLWKRRRTHDSTGKALQVLNKIHTRKRDVPTMAGLIVVAAVTIVTVLFNLDRQQTWLPLAALLGGGFVGLVDDIINVRGSGGGVAGLRAPIKMAMIMAVAAFGAWFFYYKLGFTSVHVPFAGDVAMGWMVIPLFILVVISTGNAVNISDGLDGLAGGLLASAFGAFGIVAFLQGNYGIAAFCMTVVGALLAYLWFNIAPARFFMGDVGSFALGTSLGVVAMLTNTIFLMPLIGLVFVVEAGSSLLQILSKKIFHRKIFLVAPIHHHFEALGWTRTKVTMRFWIIGQVCAVLGLALALISGFIE
ncbi:MAG TPA: phospho-N-acetylmuramoyl-pentapeptide-transferase [Candidatus Saccharimonadales bacterium]|nr:phospho-N-acetylmuramoyl-pentapeptide-transferase [Candidatus Saccharimonadales bacterium]